MVGFPDRSELAEGVMLIAIAIELEDKHGVEVPDALIAHGALWRHFSRCSSSSRRIATLLRATSDGAKAGI